MSRMKDRLVSILQNKPYGHSSYEDFAEYLLTHGVIVSQDNERTEDIYGKWISPKDKLPEDGQGVLVIVNGAHDKIKFHDAYQLAIYYDTDGFILDEFPEAESIIVKYWMPTPDAPKGE